MSSVTSRVPAALNSVLWVSEVSSAAASVSIVPKEAAKDCAAPSSTAVRLSAVRLLMLVKIPATSFHSAVSSSAAPVCASINASISADSPFIVLPFPAIRLYMPCPFVSAKAGPIVASANANFPMMSTAVVKLLESNFKPSTFPTKSLKAMPNALNPVPNTVRVSWPVTSLIQSHKVWFSSILVLIPASWSMMSVNTLSFSMSPTPSARPVNSTRGLTSEVIP